MKIYLTLVALLLCAVTETANAHAHLQKSLPAANSTITALPKDIVLTFNEAVQVTALTLQMGEGKPQVLGPLPASAAKDITVAMPTIASGAYTINWRAIGDDGHVTSGKLTFNVAAK